MPAGYARLKELIADERAVALATVVSEADRGKRALLFPDGSIEGDLGSAERHDALAAERDAVFASEKPEILEAGGDEIYVEVYAPPPKLVIVGAVHVAIPLITIAKTLGFHCVVVDARAAFATVERFPHVDELIVRWPAEELRQMRLHESTYCVFLTHDPKLDNPALEVVLRQPVRYVGALGSKKTHAKRVAALQEMGLSDDEIARIHAPIGFKLGGNRPEEIALGIAAQMVAVRYGRDSLG